MKAQGKLTVKLLENTADKGGNTVIMDNSQYEQVCMKILSNKDQYHPIFPLLIHIFYSKCYRLVDGAFEQGTISKAVLDFNRTKFSKTPFTYAFSREQKICIILPAGPLVRGEVRFPKTLVNWWTPSLWPM